MNRVADVWYRWAPRWLLNTIQNVWWRANPYFWIQDLFLVYNLSRYRGKHRLVETRTKGKSTMDTGMKSALCILLVVLAIVMGNIFTTMAYTLLGP